ncbi:MAG TPA: hypothetical protein DDX92_05060 [Flavobacteriales bacterium]|jgi:OOP family OmpA-OmpF porin|nr:hypothetical protein [Flavobacteriales bacterium]
MGTPRITVLILVFFLSYFVQAQNLVPNGSFENRRGKRYSHRPWRFVNTVDIFIKSSSRPRGTDNWNLPGPKDGNVFAGLRIYPGYREFLQIKLKKKLTAGKKYYFEMWVRWSDHSNCYAKSIGASIYHRRPAYTNDEYLYSSPPQIEYSDKMGIRNDSTVWMRISGVYRASGGEKYLTVGNFSKRKFKDRLKSSNWFMPHIFRNEAYYFVDNIQLIQLLDQIDKDTIPLASIDTNVVVPDTVPYNIYEENKVYLIEKEKTINLEDIRFEFASDDLFLSSYHDLELLLEYLNENPQSRIRIEGHTDNVGSESFNKRLSEKRARAIHNYLVRNRIDKDRIPYVGFGEEKPIATNDTPAGRQKNRRVSLTILE